MAKVSLLDYQGLDIPASWIPLLKKIIKWYNNQAYPVVSKKNKRDTPRQRVNNLKHTWIPTIRVLWAIESEASKDAWGDAAAFVSRSGYQLYVKDLSYRLKHGMPFPTSPPVYYQTHGLKITNAGGSRPVRLERRDVSLIGPVTITFNYKKDENVLTGGTPFGMEAKLFYFEDGENKVDTLTFEAPAGGVGWTQYSDTFGEVDRRYSYIQVVWNLDYYDADVYISDVLIEDKTREWSVNYTAVGLPEDANPSWAKTGDLSAIYNEGGILHLEEDFGGASEVLWSRTPVFVNVRGSTVRTRLQILSGSHKDSGISDYSFKMVHADGTYRVDIYFFRNGLIVENNGREWIYHKDLDEMQSVRSSIKDNKFRLYLGRSVVLRKELEGSGGQKVAFGARSPDEDDLDVRVGYVKYYQGADASPKEDILREGFWFKSTEQWIPDKLINNTGWGFVPGFAEENFHIVYLM